MGIAPNAGMGANARHELCRAQNSPDLWFQASASEKKQKA